MKKKQAQGEANQIQDLKVTLQSTQAALQEKETHNRSLTAYLTQLEENIRIQTVRMKEQDEKIGEQAKVINAYSGRFEAVEKEMGEQIESHLEDMKAKEGIIERLRAKVTEAASRVVETQTGSWPLRQPEAEIKNSWGGLPYEVHNFAMNYLNDGNANRLNSWCDLEEHRLELITPQFRKFALDKKHSVQLVEAAIWRVLTMYVFSDGLTRGSMSWAGKYSRKLSEISKSTRSSTVTRLSSSHLPAAQRRSFLSWSTD